MTSSIYRHVLRYRMAERPHAHIARAVYIWRHVALRVARE